MCLGVMVLVCSKLRRFELKTISTYLKNDKA